MSTQPKLVNKQFNSPIGLYSEQNIREVLAREQQMLANGAIGIDFHNPQVGKPNNLQNSAVLRMLEEEEHRRAGHAGNSGGYHPRPLQDVSWPPPDYDQTNLLRSSFKDVVTPGAKRVAWPPPQEGVLDPADLVQGNQPAPQIQGGPQYAVRAPQNNYSQGQYNQQPQQQPQSHRPLQPLDVSSVGVGSPLGSPALNQSPQGFRSVNAPKGWAPVQSPQTPLGPGAQKYFGAAPAQNYPSQPQSQPVSQFYQPEQQYQSQVGGFSQQQPSGQQFGGYQQQQQQQQPAYQSVAPPQQYQQSSTQSAPYNQNQFASQPAVAQTQVAAPRPQSVKQVEPPPSTITLRSAAPVSQAPNPVFAAQPATASLKGGKHLRGDLKWPPENVRQRMAEEQQHLIELSKGPACRPLKKDKDYTPFFEQHALNHAYPGYKIPPGTQFFRPEYE